MPQDRCVIRRETPADRAATELLTREAFWNVYRPGCLEHFILHMFRDAPDFVPELDLVLEVNGRLIGHVMYVHAAIQTDAGGVLPVMTFGPLSIHPDVQRRGYGRRLLDASLDRARELGAGAICIEGNLAFYGGSGFLPASHTGVRYGGAPAGEPPSYFLVRELRPGYLDGVTGVYHTPEGYFVDEAEAEAFDLRFPPKKRERLPGQLF